MKLRKILAAALLLSLLTGLAAAQSKGGSKNLAPGFESLPRGAALVVMQPDIELFSVSAGGIHEPKADWTAMALKHVQSGIEKKAHELGLTPSVLAEGDADELAEVNNLHGAVARAIAFHHMGQFALPTKEGKLDWSLAEAVSPLREKTQADYALFVWMRDSYASGERVATMIVLAILGVGVPGGMQVGYASLVDLKTGQIVWFNQLVRVSGDLREEKPAEETVNALLSNFPAAK